MQVDKLRGLLAEYDSARDWDAKVNEADNSGNVAGDALARELRILLNSGLTVAHVIEDYFGYVVLARRPNPESSVISDRKASTYEPVSAVFPAYPKGLEQAQNVLGSCEDRERRWRVEATACRSRGEQIGERVALDQLAMSERDSVEYVIGQISEWSGNG